MPLCGLIFLKGNEDDHLPTNANSRTGQPKESIVCVILISNSLKRIKIYLTDEQVGEKLKNRLEVLERLAGNESLQSFSLSEDFEGSNRDPMISVSSIKESVTASSPDLVSNGQPGGSDWPETANSITPLDDFPLRAHENSEASVSDDLYFPNEGIPNLVGNYITWDHDDSEGLWDSSQRSLEALNPPTRGPYDIVPEPPVTDSLPNPFNLPFTTLGLSMGDSCQEDSPISIRPEPTTSLVTPDDPGHSVSEVGGFSSSFQVYSRLDVSEYTKASNAGGRQLASDIIHQLRLDDTPENQCLVKTAIAHGHNVRDVLLAGLTSLGKHQDTEHVPSFRKTSRLPDLRKNALTLIRTSTLQAYLSIADAMVAIGMSIPALYDKTSASPFYRTQTPAVHEMDAILATYASQVTIHLRPTAPQITHLHPPWLDLIPFPNLRERVLTMTSMTPPLFDLAEFKNDVFLNNGLFCWRTSGMKGSAQPWDMRSWEAEPWFLQKWWMLLGVENTEVWEQTKWWRGMRGEKDLKLQWSS